MKIGCYWGSRRENAAELARRAAGFLSDLAELDPVFSSWFYRGESMADSFKPYCAMPPEIPELEAIIRDGLFREDYSKAPREDLGYVFGAWNGAPDQLCGGFAAFVGGYSWRTQRLNHVDIDLPRRLRLDSGLIGVETAIATMLVAAKAWAPDWIHLGPHSFDPRGLGAGSGLQRPWVGWVVYLPWRHAVRLDPPADLSTRRTPDGGLLLIATEERFNAENPEHLAGAERIHAALAPLQSRSWPTEVGF